MAKISDEIVQSHRQRCEDWLRGNVVVSSVGVADVKTGQDAWTVAHRAGVVRDLYDLGPDVHDAHIQTALEKIFPNAVFKDRKKY